MKRATGSGFLLAASLALVLRGTDADALSPSPDVLCCLSQRSACRAEPPSPEECRKILESFARVQEQWERQLPGESRLARAANALWQHSFAVLALAAGIALWVLSRKAGRGSLVARALFVAGGVSLGLGFLFLMASLQIGAR